MKKMTSILTAVLLTATAMNAISLTASAEENYIYGTMNIPYADFYRSELANANNSYEVDAVSSATTNKWKMSDAGQLFEGTYHSEENADGTGQILGVTYPVAITQADLDALGTENYNFTALESTPEAYKLVTVENNTASFSAVQDANPVAFQSEVKLNTQTRYGDYQIDLTLPEDVGAVYGIVVKTADQNAYGMTHEMNIWRMGSFSWSNGFVTKEVHGNTLAYECFDGLMGATISEITYIGLGGYYTVTPNLYIPIKFENTVSVENASAGTGKTSFSATGFPDDYASTYQIADNFTIADNEINYTDALPSSYTLTISDANGKYADVPATFILSTEEIPVSYADGKLIPAENFTDADAQNFIKNISSVTVGEKIYNTGRRGTTIIKVDGTVDFNASNREGNVFDGSGNYQISVSAVGYNKPFAFEVKAPEETITTEENKNSESTTTTTTTKNSTTNKNNSTTSKTSTTTKNTSSNASNTESPKTADSASALPAIAGITALLAIATNHRKKK